MINLVKGLVCRLAFIVGLFFVRAGRLGKMDGLASLSVGGGVGRDYQNSMLHMS